jgi:hypothetical protein
MECYQAYREGRADTDPSEGWYKGEIGFFDFYIIPLAKKLKDCGVFGVSSSEYLDYAMKNRQEWEDRGQERTSEMVERAIAHWSSRLNKSPSDVDDKLDECEGIQTPRGSGTEASPLIDSSLTLVSDQGLV